MTPAAHHLLRALYLHAMAPSTANQDAVRAAGAALDTETARALNAPKGDIGIPITEQNQGVGGELKIQPSSPVDTVVAEVRADLLARSEVGIANYGVTLDRTDLGLGAWMRHIYEELLDGALYAKRAMREMQPATLRRPGRDDEADAIEAGIEAAAEAVVEMPPTWGNRELQIARAAATAAVQGLWERMTDAPCDTPTTAPIEPPHAAAPFLATLTPEPAEAVLGRAGDALAGVEALPEFVLAKPNTTTWHPYGGDAYPLTTDGVQRIFPTKEAALRWEALKAHSGEALAGSLPVYVLAGTGRHPYGDDAWHMETDGVARLFPSKEAAHRWLAAMGRTAAVSAPDSRGYWACDCGRECRVKDGPDRLPNCRAVWTVPA